MSYPPPPDQPGQSDGYQYDPYGGQSGSQPPPPPQPSGYSPQPPGYGQQAPTPYGPPQLPPAMPPAYGGYPMSMPQNGLGTAGMVLGIIGIVLFWCGWIGIVLAILAVIFGGVGIARANKGEATNKGMAVSGVVLGVITLALTIGIRILWANFLGTSMLGW
ncbi:DUF4190 domain-containing protein [Glycomyces buryatensis]|uniref:DUF4190 domain-containing protein n=1 Tax=Glycomyces buryatensis TaxID=2570927 RepID=UPI001B3C14CF|nr:DUF4190 domain-containing protein [Glycomyces buryatensis]